MKNYTTYLSLGTNQGNKLENLQKAVDLIALKIGVVQQIASIYKTPSWGFDGEDFLNTCIKITTSLLPQQLIKKLLNIEQELGRKRIENKTEYSDRPIDIDVLFIDNEIILSDDLTVPHPSILERKFVLVPLNDIAKHYIHPQVKKSINNCLNFCSDTSDIFKIEEKIKRPIPFTEKYNYIAIEGNIGAGKTSLAKMISKQFNSKLVLEGFADNPFLPKFYQNKERYAFPLEMSFLADRYHQLSDDLAQLNLFKSSTISDYYIFKSLIFAQITLPKEEYKLYRKMFDIMYKEIRKPDLYIFLYQNTNRLLENIKKRGRDYEQNIEVQYLEKIHKGYMNFIKTQQDLNVLMIDVSNLDFVENDIDYFSVLETINLHK